MKVKGVCLHHDAGVLGSAVPKEVWKRRLLTLKKIGCNAIRTSHNLQAPDLYDLCDELGLLVLNEEGKEICRYAIQSSERPYALKVVRADSIIVKDGLTQVVVQITDENGIPVMLSDDEVTCQVEGPAKLLGLEASNNKDMSDLRIISIVFFTDGCLPILKQQEHRVR
jgi:hypothetical protein